MDKSLKDIFNVTSSTKPAKPFERLTVVLSGDFKQILPVMQSESNIDIVNAATNQSPLWKHCKIYKFQTNMRLLRNNLDLVRRQELQAFAQWLLDIGDVKIQTIA